MLSTCAKLLQSLRYFGLHFTQVPYTYSVSKSLSSHVSLSRNRHRRISEIDVYTQRVRHFTGFMLSTCAKLLQSLRYFGLHFPQVPHKYFVSQPLSSHVSLSRNRHRGIAEIDVYTQGLDISLLLCCQLVPNCFND